MMFNIYGVSLLVALEQYLPYMSDEEVKDILFYGLEPDALMVWSWEVRKSARDTRIRERFRKAYIRQK